MRRIFVFACSLVVALLILNGGVMARVFFWGESGPPGSDDVHVGKIAIAMPLGKILLARKGAEYCAIKFTKFWTGSTENDLYARYESYCQKDGSGNFLAKDVQIKNEQLSSPEPRGIGRFAFSFGNKEIKCGDFRLLWVGNGSVYFHGQDQRSGDHGIELAPTKLSEISQVNVFDSRLKWYRYDTTRKEVNIPVDELW